MTAALFLPDIWFPVAACSPAVCTDVTHLKQRRGRRQRWREAVEERKGLILQGGGRQMEIDGERDREIKRNMPLGVTEEGVRVRGMRGLQAWEPHMGKNNSSRSSSISLPLLSFSPCNPLLVGEINSRLVCLRLQEFVIVGVECVCMYVLLCLLFFLLWEAGGDFFGSIPHPREVRNPLLISQPFPPPLL